MGRESNKVKLIKDNFDELLKKAFIKEMTFIKTNKDNKNKTEFYLNFTLNDNDFKIIYKNEWAKNDSVYSDKYKLPQHYNKYPGSVLFLKNDIVLFRKELQTRKIRKDEYSDMAIINNKITHFNNPDYLEKFLSKVRILIPYTDLSKSLWKR
jgi:hypothetical protein